jgi:hypothetical protein
MHSPFGKNRRTSPITLDVEPVMQEELSAGDFLKLAQSNPGIIKASRALTPQPGRRSFGSFLVQYAYPRHRSAD